MNAKDFAHELEKAASFIRQQQAKIDTYRLQNSSQIDTHKYKPVAWMQHHYETGKVTKFSPVKVWEDDIPLYLHPAKTLTDEEIEQIGKEYGIKSVYQFAYYEFARAILRKASEK